MPEQPDDQPPVITWAMFSRAINAHVTEQEREWAGIPMPLPGYTLSIAEGHPMKDRLEEMQRIVHEEHPVPPDFWDADPEPDPDAPSPDAPVRIVNEWWSRRLRQTIVIAEVDGKRQFGMTRGDYATNFARQIQTLGVCDAWSLDTEYAAMDKLATLVKPHIYEMYVFTGQFVEQSRRSKVAYLFRRCRPTIAFKPGPRDSTLLCALCLHPIAYYEGTHAGGMCPTDDVIAHLLLMRGDEHLFWRRANQHPLDRPEAAI